MPFITEKQQGILSFLGLHAGPDILHYPGDDFTPYTSQEYLTSDRHETDEIYRMFERNLLHKESGLRITYTSAEDYYGEHVEYKVTDLFILSKDKKRAGIVDVDFERRVFLTSAGEVAFEAVDLRAV